MCVRLSYCSHPTSVRGPVATGTGASAICRGHGRPAMAPSTRGTRHPIWRRGMPRIGALKSSRGKGSLLQRVSPVRHEDGRGYFQLCGAPRKHQVLPCTLILDSHTNALQVYAYLRLEWDRLSRPLLSIPRSRPMQSRAITTPGARSRGVSGYSVGPRHARNFPAETARMLTIALCRSTVELSDHVVHSGCGCRMEDDDARRAMCAAVEQGRAHTVII